MGLFGSDNKIILQLERNEYIPGETIKGSVTLKLKKPTKARKLEVALNGIRIDLMRGTHTYGSGPHRHSRPSTEESQEVIYNQTVLLDDEKEYHENTYPFEIPIPLDILAEKKPEGRFGAVVEALKASVTISSRIEWSVDVNLDLPLKNDVNTYQKIILTEKT